MPKLLLPLSSCPKVNFGPLAREHKDFDVNHPLAVIQFNVIRSLVKSFGPLASPSTGGVYPTLNAMPSSHFPQFDLHLVST